MTRFLRAWGPALAWAVVLFLLSSVPDVGPTGVEINDKLVHVVLYLVFGATLAYGRRRSPSPPPHWLVILAGLAYAATDEWHQAYVPGRDPSVADWAADLIGILLGYALARHARSGRSTHDSTNIRS